MILFINFRWFWNYFDDSNVVFGEVRNYPFLHAIIKLLHYIKLCFLATLHKVAGRSLLIFNHIFKPKFFIMKHHIFLKVLSLFLCWSFSARESSAQEERGLQGKIIDNVYVVESFKLDTSTLGIQERKQYQKQLISLKRNVKPKSNFESRIEPPQEIKYENQVFRHVNNYCYEPSNKVVDYLVAELYPNVLEYRQNKNQINPGRSQKIVLYTRCSSFLKTEHFLKL